MSINQSNSQAGLKFRTLVVLCSSKILNAFSTQKIFLFNSSVKLQYFQKTNKYFSCFNDIFRWFIPPGPGKLAPYQEFHKEGSIILKSRFQAWGPRKIISNAHFYAVFRIVEQEVLEANDPVNQQLFVEIFKDREAFIEVMVDNLKKVEEVELEMTGGQKRPLEEEELAQDEPGDLDAKIDGLLTRFEGKDIVFVSKFFKVVYKNNKQNLAVSHNRIQKKAGDLSYNISFKGLSLKTDCASLTNLDSDQMAGRGNTGSAYCTIVPLMDLSDDTKKRVLSRFNIEIENSENDDLLDNAASQDFPFTQSQTEDTIKICEVCRFSTRDRVELNEHMKNHFQCETCSKYFDSKNDLEHHGQNHMKVKCDLCSKFFRIDEIAKHKNNHMKLKNFGSKNVMKSKARKPVTGYGLWQKEERKRITTEHPGLIFTEVNRELGKRWAKVEKTEKERWKRQAEQFNENLDDPQEGSSSSVRSVPTVEDVAPNVTENVVVEEMNPIGDETEAAIETVLVEDIDPISVEELLDISITPISVEPHEEPARKKRKTTAVEKDNDCPLCEFQASSNEMMSNHMKNEHRLSQSKFKKCTECDMIFLTEKQLKEHSNAKHEEDTEIVLVKMRKLAWPALVIKREGDIVEVKMISDDSIKVVTEEEIELFDVEKISNAKNSSLKKAFVKAIEILGGQKK